MLAEPTIIQSHDPELLMCAVVAGARVLGRSCWYVVSLLIGQCRCSLSTPPFSCIRSRQRIVSLQASFPRKRKESLSLRQPWEECAMRRLHCPGPVIHSLESEGPTRPARLDPKLQISHELSIVGLPLAKLGLTGWIPIPQLT